MRHNILRLMKIAIHFYRGLKLWVLLDIIAKSICQIIVKYDAYI